LYHKPAACATNGTGLRISNLKNSGGAVAYVVNHFNPSRRLAANAECGIEGPVRDGRTIPLRQQLQMLTPLEDPTPVRGVAFGSLRLDASGKEPGDVSWR